MGSRPLGITIIALLMAIGGVLQVITGLESMGVTHLGIGGAAAGISGGGSLLSGILTLIAAGGLFTLKGWAWLLAVIVLVIRIVAGFWAAMSMGFGSSLGLASAIDAAISIVFLLYFTSGGVKRAFGR